MPIILRGPGVSPPTEAISAVCLRHALKVHPPGICEPVPIDGNLPPSTHPAPTSFDQNLIASMRAQDLPSYDDIPAVPGMPHGCAWGLWDKNGEQDQLGALNLLTPEVVQEAGKEIQTGDRCVMNWGLQFPSGAALGRAPCPTTHKIVSLKPHFVAYDDTFAFNTQCSSQWDGFRHWAHQATEQFYNGVTKEDIEGENKNNRNGIDQWSKAGGIAGRGVLIDYEAYARRHNIKYKIPGRVAITHHDLDTIAKEQNLEFRPGDILIVRTGYTKWHEEATHEERLKGTSFHEYPGVEASEDCVKWMWKHHFAAVASDAPAFETVPPLDPYWMLHNFLLAFWGTPIGEFWDLEALAKLCEKHKRWSFFLTSAPLNIEGGVASPPNAMAIF